MSGIAVDYSFSHPDPAALKAAGVSLVIRYTTGTKALTPAEATALRNLGIDIALVHETDAGRVNSGGQSGGADDMLQVNFLCGILGYPAGGTVFFADDTAPNFQGAMAYFQGVRSRKGLHLIGWYGGLGVGMALKAAGLIDVVWVANASSWSGFPNWDVMAPVVRVNPQVNMLQSLDHPLPGIAGSSYDFDEVLRPFPVWGSAPPAPPAPPVPPMQHPSIDIGEAVNSTDISGIHLGDQGEGVIDVAGVASAKVLSSIVIGGSDPLVPGKGYQKTPITRLLPTPGDKPARIVITGGEVHGVYTVRVTSS